MTRNEQWGYGWNGHYKYKCELWSISNDFTPGLRITRVKSTKIQKLRILKLYFWAKIFYKKKNLKAVRFKNNRCFLFADIDECKVANGRCQHKCVNTEGSYYCQCRKGFKLAPDERRCRGNQNNWRNLGFSTNGMKSAPRSCVTWTKMTCAELFKVFMAIS